MPARSGRRLVKVEDGLPGSAFPDSAFPVSLMMIGTVFLNRSKLPRAVNPVST